MGVAHVGLVHCDPCECKVKGFPAVSYIKRNVPKRRHLQGMRHFASPPIHAQCGERRGHGSSCAPSPLGMQTFGQVYALGDAERIP